MLRSEQCFPGQWHQTGLTRGTNQLPRGLSLYTKPVCTKNDSLLIYRNVLQVGCPFNLLRKETVKNCLDYKQSITYLQSSTMIDIACSPPYDKGWPAVTMKEIHSLQK